MRRVPRPNTRAHVQLTQFPGHRCIDDLTTEGSFDLQAIWIIKVRGFCFTCYQLVCTAAHWQPSGRLAQELNVCTVAAN